MARGRPTRAFVVTHRARPSRSRHLAPSTQACVLIVLLQEAQVNATTKTAQIRLSRSSPAYWRITFDNPPLNVMGPQFVQEFREIMTSIEDDEQVKVVVFDSAVEGFFLNHSDFLANFEDLKRIPPGPTGLEAWPDILVRLTRAPVVSIALIRGRATGNGSEIALASDMTFVSRGNRGGMGRLHGFRCPTGHTSKAQGLFRSGFSQARRGRRSPRSLSGPPRPLTRASAL